MLSTRHHFIFLHVPKTAGNAVQTWLLPHSDDRKVTHRHQDGIERFDVRGSVTPTKHATLQAYADLLGDQFDTYATILPVRDPLERALSLYFSPHRAFGQPAGFVPAYDPHQFAALLQQTPLMVDYLRVHGVERRPSFLLRFDHLAADLAAVARHFDLPPPVLPVLNRSLDQSGQRDQLRHAPEVIALVRQRFAADYAYFGLWG
jgi:hypothetical protein